MHRADSHSTQAHGTRTATGVEPRRADSGTGSGRGAFRRRGFLGLLAAAGTAAMTEGCVTITPIAATGAFPVAPGVTVDSPTFTRMRQRNQGKGQVVVGVKDDQPGLGYLDPATHEYRGFDIEIAWLVAAGLGFTQDQVQFVTVESHNRESALMNASVDLVVASYSYTATRALEVGFAGPYYKTGEGLLVRKNDTTTTGLTSLTAGSTVCSVTASSPLAELPRLTSARISQADSYSECLTQVGDSQATGLYTDLPILAGYAAEYPGQYRVIPVDDHQPEQLYGIGLPHGDTALQNKIDTVLKTAEANGTWLAIFNATLAASGLTAPTPPPIGTWT
ncbi:MAG TPA: transporter substrate-binding domain-containing protein [Actinocrinis sp.]|nr:transporter substrate-binding domain-containing protein [Actinocrinis sp.]